MMIATAFPVGFFAGLFGIGGGLITVPFLFFIFEALDVNQIYLMHLALLLQSLFQPQWFQFIHTINISQLIKKL